MIAHSKLLSIYVVFIIEQFDIIRIYIESQRPKSDHLFYLFIFKSYSIVSIYDFQCFCKCKYEIFAVAIFQCLFLFFSTLFLTIRMPICQIIRNTNNSNNRIFFSFVYSFRHGNKCAQRFTEFTQPHRGKMQFVVHTMIKMNW